MVCPIRDIGKAFLQGPGPALEGRPGPMFPGACLHRARGPGPTGPALLPYVGPTGPGARGPGPVYIGPGPFALSPALAYPFRPNNKTTFLSGK